MRKQYFGNAEDPEQREFIIFESNETKCELIADFYRKEDYQAETFEDGAVHITHSDAYLFLNDFKHDFNLIYKELKKEMKGL